MPDFDIDFCQDRRDEVLRHVQERYGRDRVAQIITFGKLQARAALRDVGRVLQMPYGQVDRLCKMVPNNPANPVMLKDAIESEPMLKQARDEDPAVRRMLETALKLEGLYRHASTHAAGVVIGDRPLDQLVPLYRDPRSDMPVTQFNMKDVEKAGLVKFDFLGLKTLTVLQTAVEHVQKSTGQTLDLLNLPLDDPKTFAMLANADATGVFQLESSGMRDVLKKLKPDRFEDIIAVVALYRPGPMDNIPRYINCKHGKEAAGLPASLARRHPQGDLRHHDLPGTGDGDRQGAVRLHAGQCRPAAPRHGQEDQGGDGGAAQSFHRRRGRQQGQRRQGGADLRPGQQVRRLRLQQEPRRRLCAGGVPDGVSQGELSGRVPRRLDDLRACQHRQAQRLPPGADPPGHRAAAARHQQVLPDLLGGAAGGRLSGGALCTGGREECRPRRDPDHGQDAGGGRAVPQPRRFLRAHRPQGAEQAAAREPGAGRRLRLDPPQPQAGVRGGGADAAPGAPPSPKRAPAPRTACSATPPRPR